MIALILTDEQIRAIAATGGIVCPSPTPLGPGGEAPSLAMLLDHIDYMVELVGADYVGFGTDFLGQTDNRPADLRDTGESHQIIEGLLQRDHSTEVILSRAQAVDAGADNQVFDVLRQGHITISRRRCDCVL